MKESMGQSSFDLASNKPDVCEERIYSTSHHYKVTQEKL